MKIKSLLYLFLFFFMPVSFAGAKGNVRPFEVVFNAVSSPRIFNTSFKDLLRQLHGVCVERVNGATNAGNVECIDAAEVKLFDVMGTEVPNITLIQSSFFGANKCDYMRENLTGKFGKPSKIKSECEMEWYLKPAKKGGRQRYVGFEVGKKKDIVHFTIGEEQGP